jgi:hypothetical protein
VAVLIGVTVPPLTTYAVLPLGATTIGPGSAATVIRLRTVLVAVLIAVT